MVITSVITGSWFPRTKLHLKEYYVFLNTGKSHLPIDPAQLQAAHAKLGATDVAYHGGRFDRVTSRFGSLSATYHEDGLFLIMSTSPDQQDSVAKIRAFYGEIVAPALSRLYSIGTPALSVGTPVMVHPVIIVVRQTNDQDVTDLMSNLGDATHFIARSPERTVHFADNHIVIVDDKGDDDFNIRLAGEYVFFREYEHKLKHFLDLHRTVWEAIEKMRSKDALTLKDLPSVRDRLLDFQRDLSVLRARLAQMDAYLDERHAQIDDLGLAQTMRQLEAYRFAKMRIATKYMERLWSMLDDYINSTVTITGLMYQENLQKEINFQQFVFLLGSIAAIIALGALPGSTLALFGPDGKLVSSGKIVSFGLPGLMLYGGIAFLGTLIIFAVIRPLISSFKRIRATSLLGGNTRADRALPIEDDERPDTF